MQVCTSLQTDNHASTPPLSFFTGRMPFLPPNQQRQSTEGLELKCNSHYSHHALFAVASVNVKRQMWREYALKFHEYCHWQDRSLRLLNLSTRDVAFTCVTLVQLSYASTDLCPVISHSSLALRLLTAWRRIKSTILLTWELTVYCSFKESDKLA